MIHRMRTDQLRRSNPPRTEHEYSQYLQQYLLPSVTNRRDYGTEFGCIGILPRKSENHSEIQWKLTSKNK